MLLSMPRIKNWIEIQGFRAFGKKLPHVEFTSTISVLWGPNSRGKTSETCAASGPSQAAEESLAGEAFYSASSSLAV